MKLVVERFSDGELVLSQNSDDPDRELDLVFSYGAMDDEDPMMGKQRAFLEELAARWNSLEDQA